MRREATERFVRAAVSGDIAELMEVLAPDVTVWTDAGGKRKPAALHPVHGRDKALRFFGSYGRKGGEPYAVLVLDLTPDGDRVSDVYVVRTRTS